MAQAVASPIVATATEMRMPLPTPPSSRCSNSSSTLGLRRPLPRRRPHPPAWRP